MSSVSDGSSFEPEAVVEAINLLNQALAIIDKFDCPEIGARVQDVIDLLNAIDVSAD